jgi:hypothetical protein
VKTITVLVGILAEYPSCITTHLHVLNSAKHDVKIVTNGELEVSGKQVILAYFKV